VISPRSHDDEWRLPDASWPETAQFPELRTLTTSDIPVFRALRLDALRRHPEAFIPTYEEERAVDPSTIAPRFRDEWISNGNVIVGAFCNGWLAGAVGVRRGPRAKQRHKATVWLLYTDPAVRGRGVGRQLLLDAIERSRQDQEIELLHLSVSCESVAARRLYRSVGFEPYGIETQAIKLPDRYVDVELMSLHVGVPGDDRVVRLRVRDDA
jgi:ribosomal protein S18 acetylase RimI-like enzyme